MGPLWTALVVVVEQLNETASLLHLKQGTNAMLQNAKGKGHCCALCIVHCVPLAKSLSVRVKNLGLYPLVQPLRLCMTPIFWS